MIIFNAILYCFTFVFYFFKVKRINVGVYLLGLYAISSVFSVLFYNHPLFHSTIHSCTVTLGPFLYLYTVLILFFYPILKFRIENVETILPPNKVKLNFFLWFIVIVSFIRIIYTYPLAMEMLKEGADLAGVKEAVIQGEKVVKVPFPINLLYICSLLLSKIFVFIFFYVVSIKKQYKNITLWIIAFFVFVPDVLTGISVASRATLFGYVSNIILAFIVFRKFLPSKFKRVFLFISVGSLAFIFVFVASVTVMRFSGKLNADLAFWQYKYFGESFVNFNGILFGNIDNYTFGDRNFSFFREIIGLSNLDDLQAVRYNADIKSGIPNLIFYFFVGQLIIDFGEFFVLALGIVSFMFFISFFKNEINISFSKLIILQFYFRLCFEGLFYFPYSMQNGNLQIILYFLVFCFFRYDLKGVKLIKR